MHIYSQRAELKMTSTFDVTRLHTQKKRNIVIPSSFLVLKSFLGEMVLEPVIPLIEGSLKKLQRVPLSNQAKEPLHNHSF